MSESEKDNSTPRDPRQFMAILALIIGLGLFYMEDHSLILTRARNIGLSSLLMLMSTLNIYYSIQMKKIPFRGHTYDAKHQPYLFRIALTTSTVLLLISIYCIIFLIADSYV
jgi:hypothetical protein